MLSALSGHSVPVDDCVFLALVEGRLRASPWLWIDSRGLWVSGSGSAVSGGSMRIVEGDQVHHNLPEN